MSNQIADALFAQVNFQALNPPVLGASVNVRRVTRASAGNYTVELVDKLPIPLSNQASRFTVSACVLGTSGGWGSVAAQVTPDGDLQVFTALGSAPTTAADISSTVSLTVHRMPTVG